MNFDLSFSVSKPYGSKSDCGKASFCDRGPSTALPNLFADGGGLSFPWQAPNTLAESMAANMQALQAQQQEEMKRRARANSKEARKKTIEKGRNLVKRDTRNYFTTSNDATAVHPP